MSELSTDAKALIERARLDDTPRAEDKQRIRGRLAAQLGAGAFATAALAGSASAPSVGESGALLKSALVKWVAGTLAAGSVAVGAVMLTRQEPKPPVAPPVVAAAPVERPAALVDPPAPVVREQPAPVETPVAAAAPRGHRARRRSAPTFTPVGNTGSMNAEITLLAQAQQALRARDGKEALRLARQHAENFPSGALYEERVGIEAIAHCVLGEREHPAVRAFLARAPRSPLSARVRKECGLP